MRRPTPHLRHRRTRNDVGKLLLNRDCVKTACEHALGFLLQLAAHYEFRADGHIFVLMRRVCLTLVQDHGRFEPLVRTIAVATLRIAGSLYHSGACESASLVLPIHLPEYGWGDRKRSALHPI
jgi:hypothetical protein